MDFVVAQFVTREKTCVANHEEEDYYHNIVVTVNKQHFHLTLMMTSAQVVETSVTVTDNSPFQDYPHPDDHTTRSIVVTANEW